MKEGRKPEYPEKTCGDKLQTSHSDFLDCIENKSKEINDIENGNGRFLHSVCREPSPTFMFTWQSELGNIVKPVV